MESTGVYWIPLFEVLEQKGFDCLLTPALHPQRGASVSSRSLRRVPGRKSDVTDAQWIQTLHNYGLLESSFRPQADLIALRSLLRHRRSLVDHRSPHVLHTLAPPARAGVQKTLLQMNIQLSQAVSDVTGVTGQAIIRAIVAGVREPKMLASLREPACRHSKEKIATPALHQTQCGASEALTGTWREEHLFVPKQALGLFDFYGQQILECDQEIEHMYAKTRTDLEAEELQPLPKRKRNSHSKTCAEPVEATSSMRPRKFAAT